ncbi:hypothetical protein [Ralstonia pseudosolanacearum]|uniref:hypothetical protein n=1 Tax=Ralstonia pseudosolanacearum TaxID=1310165 RepID=UPI0006BD5BD5|nr:hypothetical protein ACH51_08125 [Ralstonia solanacearum]BCL97525.1 hypothetical protein MAFF211491_19770 [Ralstonia solanacearum]BCM12903.1 hypothetical protein MAFF241648_20930 [Ralstonia solanacearum]
MGIVIPFPLCPASTAKLDTDDIYRQDTRHVIGLLAEHALSDEFDGVIAMLRPTDPAAAPVIAVGGAYRYRRDKALKASAFLHMTVAEQGRAAAKRTQSNSTANAEPHSPAVTNAGVKRQLWNEATTRYRTCENLLRLAFSQQLRATPETTEIVMGITQLTIETICDCLWELLRRPGQTAPRTRLDVLNGIQDFRAARRQVAAWMPTAGDEEEHYARSVDFLDADILAAGLAELQRAEDVLRQLVADTRTDSVAS